MADDIPSRSHMMMMSRSDLQGVRREPRVARAGNQFYGALIPMFLAHDHHDEKDPYLVANRARASALWPFWAILSKK